MKQDATTKEQLTSNVVSLGDRRAQSMQRASAGPPPSPSDGTLLRHINSLSADLYDAKREIEALTNTVNKLLRLLKKEKGVSEK